MPAVFFYKIKTYFLNLCSRVTSLLLSLSQVEPESCLLSQGTIVSKKVFSKIKPRPVTKLKLLIEALCPMLAF